MRKAIADFHERFSLFFFFADDTKFAKDVSELLRDVFTSS